MTTKSVIPRTQADRDVEQAVEYYLNQDATDVAPGFVDALEAAYEEIGRCPVVDSPRYDHELNLPGLRSLPLQGFPHIVFYVAFENHVDVWRVLHGQRDIPSRMVG